jgi:cysteine desulfurase/selenocysteine lyase
MLNLSSIRQEFPIIEGNDFCQHYLDNAATVQKPQCVIDRISQFYQQENAAVHRGIHTLSSNATSAVEQSRALMASFINANNLQEIVFTKGTTESLNLVAQSWGRQNLVSDDEVIISEMEHHANIVPWQLLATEIGIKLVIWRIQPDGTLCLDQLNSLITPRTKVISVTHISNVLGTINPVERICQIAQQHNITSVVDGAQAVMHANVDVQAIGCDFYVFSGHKMYGPTGIGTLWAKKTHFRQHATVARWRRYDRRR